MLALSVAVVAEAAAEACYVVIEFFLRCGFTGCY